MVETSILCQMSPGLDMAYPLMGQMYLPPAHLSELTMPRPACVLVTLDEVGP